MRVPWRIRPSSGLAVGAVAVLFLSPLFLSTSQQSLVTRALIFALMAASLDIAYGHGGLPSLGHSALVGVGGYTVGILMVRHGVDSFWLGALAAMALGVVAAAIFGLLALRAKGIYFILVTFTLGQMISNLAQQWKFLKSTGVDAIVGIGMPSIGLSFEWSSASFLRFVLVVTVVAMLVIMQILRSPFGLALRGVRDNEQRMEALGYHAWWYKLAAIVVSGALGALAGALFAYHSGIITPTNVGVAASGLLVLMVVFGGSGTTYGPVVGGFVITIIGFYASELNKARAPLIVGLVFIATALALRGGLAGAVQRLVRRSRSGSTARLARAAATVDETERGRP